MSKISFLNPDSDERILSGRIEDLALAAENGRVGFSYFLNMRQKEIAAASILDFQCNFMFYGGLEEADRVILGLSPKYRELKAEEFPIEAITFKWKKDFSLSHRDILGTLMSLGIEIWAFGDILTCEGGATLFLSKSICENVVREVTKIGNVGVKAEIADKKNTLGQVKTLECEGVVASWRLDSIVSLLTNMSRGDGVKLINGGKVFVNDREIQHSDFKIEENDIISIRHFGKFKILSQKGTTAKGRIRFFYLKYI